MISMAEDTLFTASRYIVISFLIVLIGFILYKKVRNVSNDKAMILVIKFFLCCYLLVLLWSIFNAVTNETLIIFIFDAVLIFIDIVLLIMLKKLTVKSIIVLMIYLIMIFVSPVIVAEGHDHVYDGSTIRIGEEEYPYETIVEYIDYYNIYGVKLRRVETDKF